MGTEGERVSISRLSIDHVAGRKLAQPAYQFITNADADRLIHNNPCGGDQERPEDAEERTHKKVLSKFLVIEFLKARNGFERDNSR